MPFGILKRASIIEVFLCILCYVVIGGMLSYSGLFAYRIAELFGFTGPVSQGMLFMIFQLLLAVPAVLIIIFAGALKGYAVYTTYFGLIAYGLLAAIIFSFGCVGILNDMEYK